MYIVLNRKRFMVMSAAVLAAGLALGSVLGIMPDRKTFGLGSGERLKVVIDAGHGLPDGGAVGVNGSVEAELNLDIANRLCEILEGKGISAVMTRTDKNGVKAENEEMWRKVEDMRIRQRIIRQSDADLFVSLHMNHFTSPSVHGLRLFYSANHSEIKPLAERMQERMSELTGAKITAVKAADKSLFLMKSPPMPAILVECGFLSNPEEERKLNDEQYRSKLAWAIADTIEEHFSSDVK